ncbi:sugar phosphate isomerase/epimerase family protein [Saliphagus infecundisoli]|uniref:Sugar phosphate isomerase/epimerase family protein n=1 Tax=Saliphagus infecundisoli TaxID=1849069 RepID=A0ABD5Q9R6_9EURY|nr:sugar phosphate isomerase/epimerase family protein [Saliphagus infecundisoli]
MNVGLCTISGKERGVEEVIDLAADVGYDGVEIWGKDHVADTDPERIAERAADAGLEIPTYGSYLRCGSEEFDDELSEKLAIAEGLGADMIRVWAGSQEYGDHDEGHWKQVVADLERVTEAASDRGLSVTVEKHANTVTNDLEGARRLIEAVDHESCGLNYQPGFSIPAAELEREARALESISNQLHLQGTYERSGSERAPLAEVYYDLEAVLDPFGDFEGYANVEFVTQDRSYREAIAADLETVRSLVSYSRSA